jgi:hypothetical protein
VDATSPSIVSRALWASVSTWRRSRSSSRLRSVVALAWRVAGEVAAVALGHLGQRVRRPVGHGRQQADELLRGQAHHVAEGAVDVEQPAVEVARAQRHQRRVLHRAAPGGLGAARHLGALDVAHLPAQQPARHGDQRQEAGHQHPGQRAHAVGGGVAQRQLQRGVGQRRLRQRAGAQRARQRDAVAGARPLGGAHRRVGGRGDDLIAAVHQLHVVLARQPPRHTALEQQRRRVAHDQHAVAADMGGEVQRQAVVGVRGLRILRHLGEHAVARVQPRDRQPQPAQPGVDLRVRRQQRLAGRLAGQPRSEQPQMDLLVVDAVTQLGFGAEGVGDQRLAQLLLLVGLVGTHPAQHAQHEDQG